MSGRLVRYAERAAAARSLPSSVQARLAEEIAGHLIDSAARYREAGHGPRRAERKAIADFGDVGRVRTDLGRAHRGRRVVFRPQGLGEHLSAFLIYDLKVALFILALVILLRWQVVSAYHIPTKSMEPTLHGDPDHGDRILVNKLYYRLFPAERWQVAVFIREGDNRSLIKRIAGLPNETLDIRNGDLYIDDRIARKPPEVQEDLLVPVFAENRDLLGDLEGDPRVGLDAFETVGDWTEERGRYLAAPGEDGQARLSFRRPIADEYPGGAQRSDGIEVGDLVLAFTVVPARGCGAVGAELRENEDYFDVRIPVGSSGRTVLRRNKEEVGAAEGVFLAPGERAAVRFQSLDDRVALVVNDEEVLVYEVTDPSEGDTQPVPAVVLGVAGGGAAFEQIEIHRDLYYRSEGSLPTKIPPGHYFMLGDNSGNSADSRGGWTVAENRLVGRPLLVIWPWDRAKVVR
jgi:signal peptidase I